MNNDTSKITQEIDGTLACVDVAHLRRLAILARSTPGCAVLWCHLDRLVVELGCIEGELAAIKAGGAK